MKKHPKIPSPRERPFLWLVFLATIAISVFRLAGGTFPATDIVIFNQSASMPIGFYLKVPIGRIERGDVVVYHPPEEVRELVYTRGYTKHPDVRFLKRVAGLPGDTYEAQERGFFVNGTYHGTITSRDSAGNPMPTVGAGEHVVPEGMFLPLADATRSFDGRYTGPVPMDRIEGRAIPILAWW